MDAVLQSAGIVNAEPIGHPNIPGGSVGIWDFIQHMEYAHARGIAHAGRGDEAVNELSILICVQVLLRNAREDVFACRWALADIVRIRCRGSRLVDNAHAES